MAELLSPTPPSGDEWFELELVGSDRLFLDVDPKTGTLMVKKKGNEASQVSKAFKIKRGRGILYIKQS